MIAGWVRVWVRRFLPYAISHAQDYKESKQEGMVLKIDFE